MFYVEETDKKLIVSDSNMITFPNDKRIKEMLELQKKKNEVERKIKIAKRKFQETSDYYSAKINGIIGISISFVAGLITSDLYFVANNLTLPILEKTVDSKIFMTVTNLVIGTALYICYSYGIKFKKNHKEVKQNFKVLECCYQTEIDGLTEEQEKIVGTDIHLNSSYYKILKLKEM